ncbi:sortase, partial [Candidatus Amesbacteria bacterium]|nr:sortase [Candidatus Amesbacteria bacterium]
ALKMGVAEAKGLAHPGQIGTTFLFAHSVASPLDYARYNAVFYLLDKLVVGDDIEVVYKNKLFKYQVTSVQRLASSDTRYLRPQGDEALLVLQTCWPAGTRVGRLVLTAKRGMVY